MAVKIEIRRDDLPAIIDGIGDRCHQAVVETAMRTQQGISQRTPHRRLRRSLRRQATRRADGSRAEIKGAWWWYFSEYGTRHQSATPAVVPTLEVERRRFVNLIRDAVSRA